MITANDLKGIMAMMPAFTTKDGDRPDAEDTVNTAELTRAVDQIIRDGGANVITTTGSFGEFHTLLWEEHKKLIEATVAAVKKRVPVFVGCTSLNPREAIRQARFAQDAGADGLLLGVPFYYQATVDNAVQFYHDVADALPKMGVMIYHNPTHHRVTIPVGAFKKITEKPNIVGMKDSHRTPLQFVELMNTVKGKISVFVNQNQGFPYAMLGATGCWSFNVWMGPEPVIALRGACVAQDWEKAK
jgi:4-(2-carboxyphenyl)-2-oxobut-3-enoate aldolase